jgi:hypothetical protein
VTSWDGDVGEDVGYIGFHLCRYSDWHYEAAGEE